MQEGWLNDLAEVMGGSLAKDHVTLLTERLLSDPEALQTLSLLSAPDLQVENNYPLPFETPATLFVGSPQGFLLPLSSEGITYTPSTRWLWSRLRSLVGVETAVYVGLKLDFSPASNGDSSTLEFSLKADVTEDCFCVRTATRGLENQTLEFWQGGTLVLRAPMKILSESPPFRMKPGLALDIRVTGEQEGVRILVIETEFTRTEWLWALVSLCLAGDLLEASRILGTKLISQDFRQRLLTRVESQIRAICAVTRSDGFLLQPSPATRSPTIARDDLLSVYGLIWNGITHNWPAAANIPNPWSDTFGLTLSKESVETPRDAEIHTLAKTCLRAAHGDPLPDEIPLTNYYDSRIRDGWRALLGWKALLSRQYEKAYQLLASSEPVEEDPYSLRMAQALALHLGLCESNGGEGIEASSDKVWRKVLSSLF